MHQNVLIQYVNTPSFSAVKIPYGNGMWEMMVMLPKEGEGVDNVINDIATNGISCQGAVCEIEDGIATMSAYGFMPYEVDLKIPRFETSSDTDNPNIEGGLIGLMQKMGIRLAFDDSKAEIPNMSDVPVWIAMMRQKAKIKVNEEGSEAAAVTVAGMMALSANSTPPEYPKATFHANRPFVYVIREASSGVILFVGKFTGA